MQRYFAKDRVRDCFILEDSDIHHISHVMRMKSGDFIEVVFSNSLFKCRVDFSCGFNVFLDSAIDDVVSDTGVVLIVPVLKEQKMDLVLQKATELGVSSIIPIITDRCVVKVSDKEERKLDRWRKIVKEASEQSKRLNVPILENIRRIDELNFSDGVKFVCSTREKSKNIKKIMNSCKNCDKMYIVVGPEGGITDSEEDKLNSLGFVSISLGSRILRVETVPLFILSIINYEMME